MHFDPQQFTATTNFHKDNLQKMLEQHIDLPEAAGILVAMIYLQKSLNAAHDMTQKSKKKAEKPDE